MITLIVGSWNKARVTAALERIVLRLRRTAFRWGVVVRTPPGKEGLRRAGIALAICLAPAVCFWIWSRMVLGHAVPGSIYIYLVMAGITVVAPSIEWIAAGFKGEETL